MYFYLHWGVFDVETLPNSYANGLVISYETEDERPTETWSFQLEGDRCLGTCDGADALIQTMYAILQTERGAHFIYPPDYGLQMNDLRDKPAPYMFAMLQTRIREALLYDDRITGVKDISYESSGDSMVIKYNVHTTLTEKMIKGAYYVR